MAAVSAGRVSLASPMANRTPRVWLLLGDKLGDNRQVEVIADALGWPCQVKRLVFRAPYVQGKPRFKASLYHVDAARSDPLEPPWPDLVITIGRRPSMAALWVRRQSGGRTKLVLLGRPKRFLDRFDLVVTAAQYRLPDRPNVLQLDLPLMRADPAALLHAATTWAPRLAGLKRPLIAVLVGGPTKPFVFDAQVAADLLDKVRRLAAEAGGTLYVTTSRRTPAAVVEALGTQLPPDAVFYRWEVDNVDNPYLALLGLADRFVVTGDSMSMLVEVARLGKPLVLFPLPRHPAYRLREYLLARLHPGADNGDQRNGLLQLVGDILYKLGAIGYSRNLTAVHELLVERKLAAWLGDPLPPFRTKAPDELPRVVERIRTLIDELT